MDPQLLAQLPTFLRFTVILAVDTFGQGNEIDDERIQNWLDDIAAGVRTEAEIAEDIRENIIGEDVISAWVDAQLGEDDTEQEIQETTQALLAGTQTFAGVVEESGLPKVVFGGGGGDIGDDPGFVGSGGTILPSGATLLRVVNPTGSDADALFFVTYQAFGVNFAYEVGDVDDLTELFPGGIADFDQFQSLSGSAFNESDFINVGMIDEIIGAEESLQSVLERGLEAAGMESLPDWILNDQTALTVFVTSVQEGWSPGHTANELANTEAFKTRFGVKTGAFQAVADAIGTDDPLQVTAAFTAYEDTLRTALRAIRGANTDTSTEYLGQLIATGWSPEELIPVLEAERVLLDSPEELAQTNEILNAFGLGQVDEAGFIDILTGQAPAEVFDALNTAAAFQAIAEQGIDVDAQFLAELDVFDTATALGDQTQFTDAAMGLARLLAENFSSLQVGAFGLTREDLIAASFGVTNPESGKSASEIEEALGQIQRSFAAQARGFTTPQAFLDQRGRLRVAGFGDL